MAGRMRHSAPRNQRPSGHRSTSHSTEFFAAVPVYGPDGKLIASLKRPTAVQKRQAEINAAFSKERKTPHLVAGECTICHKHGVVLTRRKQTGEECTLLWYKCLLCGDTYEDVFD